jgi:diazepam-binding inhibitor (GABA receptor modulating acyl-CoA-binding protein)
VALKDDFQNAANDVKKLTKRPDNGSLLSLYSIYKQATEGDVTGSRPGMLDIKGRAKFDAWSKIKGTPAEKAMQDYVSLVRNLQTTLS